MQPKERPDTFRPITAWSVLGVEPGRRPFWKKLSAHMIAFEQGRAFAAAWVVISARGIVYASAAENQRKIR